MIKLDEREVQYILYCKGHLQDKYPLKGYWHESFKPMFTETYGWNPDEDDNNNQYLNTLFNKLLGICQKIDEGDLQYQLRDIFSDVFYKGISNDSEEPIERGIHALCGFIQANTVLNEDGSKRYDLGL
jgi:hypothetical protein